MADEQRTLQTVEYTPEPAAATGESKREQATRLMREAEQEEAQQRAADLEKSPPRPIQEIALDFMRGVSQLLGNHPSLDVLVAEAKRALGQ